MQSYSSPFAGSPSLVVEVVLWHSRERTSILNLHEHASKCSSWILRDRPPAVSSRTAASMGRETTSRYSSPNQVAGMGSTGPVQQLHPLGTPGRTHSNLSGRSPARQRGLDSASHYIGPTGENWIMDDAPRTPVVRSRERWPLMDPPRSQSVPAGRHSHSPAFSSGMAHPPVLSNTLPTGPAQNQRTLGTLRTVPRTAATLASINATNMTAYPALDVSYKHDRPGHGLCQVRGGEFSDFHVPPTLLDTGHGALPSHSPQKPRPGVLVAEDMKDAKGPMPLGVSLLTTQVISDVTKSAGPKYTNEVASTLEKQRQLHGDSAKSWYLESFGSNLPAGRRDVERLEQWLNTRVKQTDHKKKVVHEMHTDDLRKITQTMAEELHHTEMLKSRLKKQARHKEVMQESYDVYTVAMNELVRQVSIGCVERGRLMARLWESCLKLWSDLLETNDSLTQDVKGFMPKSDGVLNLTPSFAVELVNPLNTQLTELRATCSCCSSSLLAGGQGYNQLVKRFNTLSELMTNDANAPRQLRTEKTIMCGHPDCDKAIKKDSAYCLEHRGDFTVEDEETQIWYNSVKELGSKLKFTHKDPLEAEMRDMEDLLLEKQDKLDKMSDFLARSSRCLPAPPAHRQHRAT
ncbi:hypothetical protein CYMTET_13265 [Cymbomonas tetramitiformis]|uniref:Uncharacterized protein n=1 Tax=Cymbomonas tetramitiformis TaxID=36881 RepID=A0AAE0LBM7_9CHLO|nr:hypothetical protein CYMTET_13265 [Cymbomonas tetramitiformis]